MQNMIALITLIATIITPITIYLISRNKKELSYKVASSTLLTTADPELRDKLRIFIGQNEIKDDIYLVLLNIINSGNVPIKKEDFTEEIEVILDGELLLAEVKETVPKNLNITLNKNLSILSGFSIKPLLLNKSDQLTIKILSSKDEKNIVVNSRIIDVKEIIKYKEPMFTKQIFISIILLGLTFTALIYFKDNQFISSVLTGVAAGFLLTIIQPLIKVYKNNK